MLYQTQETSAEKQQRLAQELLDELDDETESEAEVESQLVKRNKGKTVAKKKPRTKQRAKRAVSDSDDETTPTIKVQVEVTQPQPSISQPQLPNTFNLEEVKPEQVEYDFDINSLVFPKYRLSPDRPRARRSRKQPTTQIQIREVPQISKDTFKKETEIYIADIEEISNVNLFLDEVDEVNGVKATARLPDRLIFSYKGGNTVTRPLDQILKESYKHLTQI